MRAADSVVSPAAEPPGESPESRTLAGGMGLGVRADDLPASVVPERGMPTMNTGAGSAFPARGPRAYRSGVKVAIAASLYARVASRENGCSVFSNAWPLRHRAKALASSPMRDQNFARP